MVPCPNYRVSTWRLQKHSHVKSFGPKHKATTLEWSWLTMQKETFGHLNLRNLFSSYHIYPEYVSDSFISGSLWSIALLYRHQIPSTSLYSIITIFLSKCNITHSRINNGEDAVKQNSRETQLGTLLRDKAGQRKPALPQGEKLPPRISNHVSPQASWHMNLLIPGVGACDGRGCPWEWHLGTAIWAQKEEGNNLFSEK